MPYSMSPSVGFDQAESTGPGFVEFVTLGSMSPRPPGRGFVKSSRQLYSTSPSVGFDQAESTGLGSSDSRLAHLVKQKLVEWSNFPDEMVFELLEWYDVSLQRGWTFPWQRTEEKYDDPKFGN